LVGISNICLVFVSVWFYVCSLLSDQITCIEWDEQVTGKSCGDFQFSHKEQTARAGRAGNAITFVTQYDVETFKRIEGFGFVLLSLSLLHLLSGLIGVRLDSYPIEESDVLAMLPQVETAEKLAADQIREQDQEEKDKKKKSKKSKQRNANFANAGDGGDSERGSSTSLIKRAKVEKKKL
jgi:superfamily II DNA/RNA helicase